MRFLQSILFVFLFACIDGSIYVYNTDDSESVELYDCIFHQSMLYCRRPKEPIRLQRDKEPWHCFHNGTHHSYQSLSTKNITVSEILHGWKSGIDQADEYSHYRNEVIQSNETEKYVCECTQIGSFGKHCEYLLASGETITDTAFGKFDSNSTVQRYAGNVVCYQTVECHSALLCLDWREICNGVQRSKNDWKWANRLHWWI